MSYANGVIYIDTSVTPNIGVSWYDVQRALGTSETDEGTLCTRPNINKWARYKPERAAGPTPLLHGSIYGQTRTRKTNHFGLEVPFCTLDIMNGKVYNILERTETGWDYLKPQGDRTAQGGVKEF